ncbi:MAG TPA: protein phosphatase 2C domain-containing protein [Actinospica sp.]|jgi:hypothetical protein|nr:protein phosphatase 2C domain-containing protein [Actinospica sp.]
MDAYWETMQASAHRGPAPYNRDRLDLRVVAGSVLVLTVADGGGSAGMTHTQRGHLGSRWAVEELMRRAVPFARSVADIEDDADRWPLLVDRAKRLGGEIRRNWRDRARMHEANNPGDGIQRATTPVPPAALSPYGSSVLGVVISPSLLFAWQLGSGDIALAGERGTRVLFDDRPRGDVSDLLSDVRPGRQMRFHWQPTDTLGACRLVLLNTDGLTRAFADRAAYHGFVENLYARSVRRGAQAVRDRLGGWLDQAAERSTDDATLVAAYADH